jgi:transposase-like protein
VAKEQMVKAVVICPSCKMRYSKTVPIEYATAEVFGTPKCPGCGTDWTPEAALAAGVPDKDPSPGINPKAKGMQRGELN